MADQINIQAPTKGFGSYLSSILPPDIATAAGAFAASMGQVKNIRNNPIEKVAQVITNIETTKDLPLIAGTNVPANLQLRTLARPKIALGSGPQGSYTMSDFFGCMSGLPYNGGPANPAAGKTKADGWYNVFGKLNQLATRKLFNIYHENYLAITWERAHVQISQSVYSVPVQSYIAPDPSALPPIPGQPRIDNWYYTVNFSLTFKGHGYGRGQAKPPIVTLYPNNCGGSMIMGVDYNDRNTPTTFGECYVVSKDVGTPFLYTTTSVWSPSLPSQPAPPVETIEIEAPPIDMIPVQANGDFGPGTNAPSGYSYKMDTTGAVTTGTAAWDEPMNTVIQGYINQANQEIDAIYASNTTDSRLLNDSWNQVGAQLTIEQRARQTALRPPLNGASRENYLSMYPTAQETWVDALSVYGRNTEPHMSAQTIEAISDLDCVCGQSIVGTMRENRNQDRLTLIGVPLDNNIPSTLTTQQQAILIANGALPTSTVNANIPSGSEIAQPGTTVGVGTGTTAGGVGIGTLSGGVVGDYTGDTGSATNQNIQNDVVLSAVSNGYIDYETGRYIVVNPEVDSISSVDNPTAGSSTPGLDNLVGSVLDVGAAEVPGSFAGSSYSSLIPPNLNNWYLSNTMLPSVYKINEAIEEVIRCNCDCWVPN